VSASNLIARLRRQGAVVTAQQGQLHVNAPKGLLTEAIRTDLIDHKAELLRLLESEQTPAPSPTAERVLDVELGMLVEKVGQMQQYIWARSEEWSDEEWARRRDMLLDGSRRMWARLEERGERVEDYGWTYSFPGYWWHRTDGADSTRPPEDVITQLWRLVGQHVPAGAITWGEQHAPELLEKAMAAAERMDQAEDAEELRAAAIEMARCYQALTERFRARRLEGADLLEAVREVFPPGEDPDGA
jgi:hypothetical protein